MNPALYIAIFLPIWLLIITRQRKKKKTTAMLIKKRKNKKETYKMLELAKQFMGKDCLIYLFEGQISGIIKEVSDGAVLLENNGVVEAINLDYVMRIREYPKNKNGKRKSVVLD